MAGDLNLNQLELKITRVPNDTDTQQAVCYDFCDLIIL